jgi:hypothetical protein
LAADAHGDVAAGLNSNRTVRGFLVLAVGHLFPYARIAS